MEEKIRNGFDLVYRVVQNGLESLSKEEYTQFMQFEIKNMSTTGGGGTFEYAELEAELKGQLNVSRDQIATMKNPYAPKLRRALLVTAIIGIGGNLGTALLAKVTGWDLGAAYLGFCSVTGGFALRVGDLAVRKHRFKKLQRAYNDPNFQEGEINAAVYRIIHDRVKEELEGGRD
ncbi:MAG: hypothetical protein K5922_01720 [Clostridiales bacterium]|nr:hypothetical protein [Clostridiales bacterium]